jgi:formylglycine-generating enzyme required for sulfatase activity
MRDDVVQRRPPLRFRRFVKTTGYVTVAELCAPTYCLRYGPAARRGEAIDTSAGHIGFRCIVGTGS